METPLNIPNVLVARLTNIASLAALRAGDILRRGFGSSFQIDSKEGKHNLITEYDTLSEKAIIEFISSHFPDHAFLAEESGVQGDHDKSILWIIDPLDGTVNFAHNIPCFSISIAATYQKEVLCAVIYNPLLHEFFVAEKDRGAYLNGRRLKVTSTHLLSNSFAATGFPYNTYENPLHCIEHFTYMAKLGIPLRRMGSACLDLAYLAAGRYDAFWEVSLNPWDYVAGKLLIEEAGGKFTDFTGKPFAVLEPGPILASNGIIHQQLVDHFKHTYDTPNS